MRGRFSGRYRQRTGKKLVYEYDVAWTKSDTLLIWAATVSNSSGEAGAPSGKLSNISDADALSAVTRELENWIEVGVEPIRKR